VSFVGLYSRVGPIGVTQFRLAAATYNRENCSGAVLSSSLSSLKLTH
jgi:hypothetical protein